MESRRSARLWWVLAGLVGLLILASGGNFLMFNRSEMRTILFSMMAWLSIIGLLAVSCWAFLGT